MCFISCLSVADWHFWCCGWNEWCLLCSKFHGYKHMEQQPGLHHSSTECLLNYCLSSHLGKMKKNWFKICLPLIFTAKHWGRAWWWGFFGGGFGVFLRTVRSVLEKRQWNKGFGFSSVGLSLEFWSLLRLISDRNAVCIFITALLLPCFHFHFPLPHFSSSFLPFLPLLSPSSLSLLSLLGSLLPPDEAAREWRQVNFEFFITQ